MTKVNAILIGILVLTVQFQLAHQQRSSVDCGIKKIKLNEVILRGSKTSPGSWPWHAAIYHRSDSGTLSESYACGGTLVSSQFVLTAEHCTKADNGHTLSNRRIFVKLGIHQLDAPDSRGLQTHNVLKIHLYEDPKVKDKNRNDIALLELSTEARFTDYVQPACINTEKDLTGQIGSVPGWGYTEFDSTSIELKVAQLPVVDTRECLKSDPDTFGWTLDISLFCAGYLNGTGVCNGDSGGGLVFKIGQRWYVGGIVSFTALREDSSNLCKTNALAGFTNVHNFLAWIEEVTGIALLEDKTVCGKRVVSAPRIAGETKVIFGRWPWQISLRQWRKKAFLHKCDAALLNENWAITAAHCVENVPPSELLLRLGEYDLALKDESNGYQERRVQIVATYPTYDPQTFENDLAMTRAYETVVFQPNIIPICVPEVDENLYGRTTFVNGWERKSKNDPEPNALREATASVIENKVCENIFRSAGYNESIPQSFICATWERADLLSCERDTGGLMVSQRPDQRFLLVGISSWGRNCSEPDVYTRVSEFRDWINQIMAF